jgi:hypothetical protein
MKTLFRTLIFFCLASAVVACSGKKKSSGETTDNVKDSSYSNKVESSEEILNDTTVKWGSTDLAAIAFIGYYNDTEKALEIVRKEYKHDAKWVEMEGDECYLIIPRSSEAMIDVRKYSYDEITDTETTGEIIYNGNEAPILLRCNISDIHANAQVTITLNDKKAILVPKLDLRDGTIDMQQVTSKEEGTVVDITKYKQEINESNEQSCIYDYDPMHEIKPEAQLNNGEISIIINKEEKEACFKVEGLDGVCEKIFWGNWGQDINPLLCMLMEDGGVEILDLNNAIANKNYFSSGRLPSLKNIVSFKQYNHQEGTGVVAIDSNGKEHDIELFLAASGKLYHFEEKNEIKQEQTLIFSPDWKFYFCNYYDGGDADEKYYGRFSGKPFLDDNETATYTYELIEELGIIEAKNESEYDEFTMVKSNKSGSFTMQKIKKDDICYDYEIKATSGEIKFARISNKPRYNHKTTEIED